MKVQPRDLPLSPSLPWFPSEIQKQNLLTKLSPTTAPKAQRLPPTMTTLSVKKQKENRWPFRGRADSGQWRKGGGRVGRARKSRRASGDNNRESRRRRRWEKRKSRKFSRDDEPLALSPPLPSYLKNPRRPFDDTLTFTFVLCVCKAAPVIFTFFIRRQIPVMSKFEVCGWARYTHTDIICENVSNESVRGWLIFVGRITSASTFS